MELSQVFTRDEFMKEARRSRVVALTEKLILDAETPISLLYRFLEQEDLFLLEGILGTMKHDRFSYLGFDCHATIECFEDRVEITYKDGRRETRFGNMFDIMKDLRQEYEVPVDEKSKYRNGLIGFMTYECVQFVENISFPEKRELGMPLARFVIPHNLIVIDNLDRSVVIIRNAFVGNDSTEQSLEHMYDKEKQQLEALIHTILTPQPGGVPRLDIESEESMRRSHTSNTSKEQFIANAERCKEYICAGDIFQIQISRRNQMPIDVEPVLLYRHLRHINPSPFMFFIKFNGCSLIGASPELLVKVENGSMYHRPIAGTRKRHSTTRTESEIVQELLNDEKEIAEHIMLVDLARNDIGRICDPGTVNVDELMTTEFYSHVIHMVSNVEGKLKEGCDAIDALKSSFPAGTVTGAPKIRAMEIISELEQVQREFYSGGIVFLDFQGNLKCALTIRTMFVKDQICYTQAAAGMVYDSVPEKEYMETENKMRACLTVMSTTKGGFSVDCCHR
jgi:anthranilate synthase component 1